MKGTDMIKTNRELAEHMLDCALLNYDRDGQVVPAFLAVGGVHDFSVGLRYHNVDVPPLAARVISGFINVVRSVQVSLVFEGWGKTCALEEEAVAAHVKLGDLQRAHDAGDKSVHTILSTTTFRVDQPWSEAVLGVVDVDDPARERVFNTNPEGRVADLLQEACGFALMAPMTTIVEFLRTGADLGVFKAIALTEAA